MGDAPTTILVDQGLSPTHDEIAVSSVEKATAYRAENKPFDPDRPVKVIIVGAGIAGIAAGVLLPRKVRNLSCVVYEKNQTVGGTWAENVYPGVRCDVPSHSYQLTFAPNLDWTEYYPKGAEIREYYERVVEEYGLKKDIQFRREVIASSWIEEASQWEVSIRDLSTGRLSVDRADFLINAQGRINRWSLPAIPGLLTRYQGLVCHTAKYNQDFDASGKKIAIIGNGASGQQLLSNIASRTAHIDHYIRSRTWVSPTFRGDMLIATGDQPGGALYSEEQRKAWREQPELYLQYRRELDSKLHGGIAGAIVGSEANEALRQRCLATMLERLDGDEEWLRRIVPDYAPGCKRLTPGPGYLETIKSSKVEYIESAIVEATETGLITADGTHREVDAIIAATGPSNGFLPLFSVIGQDGIDLSRTWAADGVIGYPKTYFGVMAPKCPNYFFILQAQGNGGGGSVPLQCEISATYIAKAIRKVQSQSYASIAPSDEATDEFNEIVEGYFDDKVSGDTCNSWMKSGRGKQRALIGWPGTGHHRFDIKRDPRWEDFVFKRRKGAERNRYEYFGNGETARERRNNIAEITKYLQRVGDVDLATLHEAWNS